MDLELREPVVAYGKKYLTIEECLAFEKASEQKYEYYLGKAFAMTGASSRHNLIFSNLFIDIGGKLKGSSCKPYGSDLRIHIPDNTLFTYPDITIICGDIIPCDCDNDTAVLTSVIIEIISESNRNYDHGAKFTLYRDIPALKESY